MIQKSLILSAYIFHSSNNSTTSRAPSLLVHQNSREHSTDRTINRTRGELARVTLPSAISLQLLLDSLPFSFLVQNWLPWRPYISMKLQVFIPVSFEQLFSEKTSFPENEFLCWATRKGERKKLHGTTENLPSPKQSSGSWINENIYILKLGMYNSGFLPKMQLYPTIHSSLNKLCVTTYKQLWLFPSTQGPWQLLTLRLLKSHILLKPSKTGQPCPIYRWLLGTALLPDNYNLDIWLTQDKSRQPFPHL